MGTILIAQAQAPAVPTVSQGLLLGIAAVLLFPVSVYATASMAKKVEAPLADYTGAIWATVFKNMALVAGAALLYRYLHLPPLLVLCLVASVFPILIYKRVFSSTLSQATTLWVLVLLIEIVVAICLVVAALGVGAWLDKTYDLPALFQP